MFRLFRAWILFLMLCGLPFGSSSLYAQQHALAIFNLIPTSMEAMGYNGDILYAIVSTLEKEKSVPVMPRREMEEILFHAGIVQGDNVEMVLKAGKVLNTRFVLFGRVAKTGNQIEACLRLMDVKKGSVLKTWTPTYVNRDAIVSNTPAIAKELIAEIQKGGQPDEPAVLIVENALNRIEVKSFRAESQEKNVLLKWELESERPIVGYNLYRSENPDGPYQHLGRGTENSFVDSSTKKGRSYFYRLGALVASGDEIKFDQTVQIRSVGEKLPHPPLILEGRGHIRRAILKFVPSLRNDQEKFSIRGYKIYRRKQPQDRYETILTIPAKISSQSEPAFIVEDNHDLEDNETYMYAISSLEQEERESPLSNPVSITTVARPVLSKVQDNLLRRTLLAWEPIERVSGYYLYRRAEGKDWEKIGRIDDPLASKIEDSTGLDDAKVYEYYLCAFDTKGETGPSNPIRTKTKELPQPPADLQAEGGLVKSVRLSWAPLKDPDVGGYVVYRGTQPEALKQIAKIKDVTADSYLDKGSTFASLEDGATYHYVISSFNLFGAEGVPTPAATARTKPRPIAVRGLMVKTEEQQILIQWEPNPEVDIETYFLSRSRNNGFWFEVAKTGADQTRFSDTDLKPDSQYRYKITVHDRDGLESDPVQSDPVPSPVTKPQK